VLVLLVYSSLINIEGYNYWIKYFLLPYYNPYLVLRLVVIIDNISFHYLPYIAALFKRAGVKLIYLPAYLLDLNLIKEFFSKLKEFI
jgi:transposase